MDRTIPGAPLRVQQGAQLTLQKLFCLMWVAEVDIPIPHQAERLPRVELLGEPGVGYVLQMKLQHTTVLSIGVRDEMAVVLE